MGASRDRAELDRRGRAALKELAADGEARGGAGAAIDAAEGAWPAGDAGDAPASPARVSFPFPDRATALRELERDPVYPRIPEADRHRIAAQAWEKGCRAARDVFAEEGGSDDFEAICGHRGVTVVRRDVDCVHGTQRYFSDYVSGRSEITLYERSCELWARTNGMTLPQAEGLILSHELFHVLEWTRLGLTSREYRVPMVQVGPLRLGSTGVRALSEIGAHAFARTYHELLVRHAGRDARDAGGGAGGDGSARARGGEADVAGQ
jgi:hypothetical protein